MAVPTPLAELIQTRMDELGLDRQALGFRLGYQNPLKAAGRVGALCSGQIRSAKSRAALQRLPEALEINPEEVESALAATEAILAELERQAEEQRRQAQDKEEAEWRASFHPHAVILTELNVPSQIFSCGVMGGTERFRIIRFDDAGPPLTFVPQVLKGLPGKVNQGGFVPFFGKALGFVVNYSPDQAVRGDLDGTPLEVLAKAYRIGEVQLWIGRKRVEPAFMARLLAGELRAPERDA